MSDAGPRVTPFGESAYLVELGSEVDPAVNAHVHALARRLDSGVDGLGIGRTVPAYASLLVPFEAGAARVGADAADLASRLRELASAAEPAPAAKGEGAEAATWPIEIPVRYGYDDGPDLDEVARLTGIAPDYVIDQHAAAVYRVYMLGFAPGFAYLGPLPEPLRVPRRAEPRLRVPAGSVAVAGAQTAVYPQETAGGWHIIGRTDVSLWDPSSSEPARLRPGDLVRFVPA